MNAKLNAGNLATLERSHDGLLRLCLTLEEIADSLPIDVDKDDCLDVARDMVPLLKQAHLLEEQVLFPDFDSNAGSRFAGMVIERLKAEHRCDALACEEMVQTLKAVAEDRCELSADTLRYMFHGFLEGVRRHVSSEKLMIEALLAAQSEGREILA